MREIPMQKIGSRSHFSSLSIQLIRSRVYFRKVKAVGRKPPKKQQAKIEPVRRLPRIGLSHLAVWKIFDQFSRFNTNLYGRNRTKPRMQSEIRQVLARWNTPARLVAFPSIHYVYKTSAYSKRCETNSRYTDHERPATSGFCFNTDLYAGFGPTMR